MDSPRKKSRSSKAHKGGTARCAVRAAYQRRNGTAAGTAQRAKRPPAATRAGTSQRDVPTTLRQEFRAWRASLPTQLERDTLLMPEAVAESVVSEASRYLKADLPEDFAERLAKKAHYLYGWHKHFYKALNRPGDGGRDNLYMYMRHWTCSWLKREHYALYKRLPSDYALGLKLPGSGTREARGSLKFTRNR